MPRSVRDVMAGLERKGFVRRNSKDSYFHLWVAGKKTPIYTKMSHGEREIHDGLLAAMARQVRLSTHQFGQLIDCPLTVEQYIRQLREGGQIG
jgi:predicted RNA binding protein YcfA (HicA-like mRNA interferase family)